MQLECTFSVSIFPGQLHLIEDALGQSEAILDYRHASDVLKSTNLPIINVLGNHDCKCSITNILNIWNINSTYYMVKLGEINIICMDSSSQNRSQTVEPIASEQVSWLSNSLKKAEAPCIVAVHHLLADRNLRENPWFYDTPGSCMIPNRKIIRSIISRSKKVLLVINGHAHDFDISYVDDIPYCSIPSCTEKIKHSNLPSGIFAYINISSRGIELELYNTPKGCVKFPINDQYITKRLVRLLSKSF